MRRRRWEHERGKTARGRGSKRIGLGQGGSSDHGRGAGGAVCTRCGVAMLGAMVLNDVWVGVLRAVHDMLVCATEVERAAEAVREAEITWQRQQWKHQQFFSF